MAAWRRTLARDTLSRLETLGNTGTLRTLGSLRRAGWDKTLYKLPLGSERNIQQGESPAYH